VNDLITLLLRWVSEHTLWAGVLVFFVAFSESVALFGLLVPGVLAMFGFGALIASGALDFWPVFFWAVAGAVTGDGLSYWLGHHYQDQLRGVWPFARYPATLERGVAFFEKYGGKSVAIGRFFGPVRAIIPLVAGMMGMSPGRFLIANLSSALLWAPAYLLPGIVFGASLKLASEVAFRLVALMVLVLVLTWGVFMLARLAFRLIQPHATYLVQRIFDWGQLHRGFRGISTALADPDHPEAKGLTTLATLLILAAAFFALLTGLMIDGETRFDRWVYSALQSLRTPWGDRVMVLITSLGDLSTTLIFSGLAVGLLFWLRHTRAAYYLLAATGFGVIAPLLLKAGLQIPRPPISPETLSGWSYPSAHVLRSMTIYGFYTVMLARSLVQEWRWLPYSLSALIVVAVALSRLYLGVHWITDVLGSITLGLFWVALLGIAYYRHVTPETHPGILVAAATLMLTLSLGIQGVGVEQRQLRYQDTRPIQTVSQSDWLSGAAKLPEYRQDLSGGNYQALDLQWAGSPQRLAEQLAKRGWEPARMLSWHNLLRLLSPSTHLTALPVLPQVHDARHESLVLVKPLSQDSRLVLRLWKTPRILDTGRPLFVGNVSRQSLEVTLDLFALPETVRGDHSPLTNLRQDLQSLPGLSVHERAGGLLLQPTSPL
jgi:membrane protein DedA with SNARE-associated domain/membrane-associated phospholipid phosphatase